MFYTKDYYQWIPDTNGYRYCQATCPLTGNVTELKYHTGVSKILGRGELSLKDKLIKELGKEAGEKKAKEVFDRGSAAHAKIEEDVIGILSEDILRELGEIVAQEVLLWNSNIKGNKVIGFADAITCKDGKYSIVDFKTKKSAYSLRYGLEDSLAKAYTQCIFYSILMKGLHNIEVESVKTIFVFLDGDSPLMYTLNRFEFMPYAKLILNKLAI